MSDFKNALSKAIQARLADKELLAATNTYRIFNGVFEGEPSISIDIFGSTVVIQEFSPSAIPVVSAAVEILMKELPGIDTVLVKQRRSHDPTLRNGKVLFGDKTSLEIQEFGVRYAVDLIMNHDSGFYLDTALLRKWLIDNAAGKRVLNTFAYTGSLGLAALGGGAGHVVQQDKSKVFLNFARKSATLNGFPIDASTILVQDFFPATAGYRKHKHEFDIVLLDPPFFSTTGKGKVSLEQDFLSLVNKVRPIVADQGTLILVNNAVFLSGKQMMDAISPIFSDGYITIQERIPVPMSFVGYRTVPGTQLPTDPSPFGHSTKILILKVVKK